MNRGLLQADQLLNAPTLTQPCKVALFPAPRRKDIDGQIAWFVPHAAPELPFQHILPVPNQLQHFRLDGWG